MPKYYREVQVDGKSAQELYDMVSEGIDRFLSKGPLSGYELERNPQSRVIKVDSKMASFDLQCLEGRLVLNGKLSLIAAPFKGKLDQGIDAWVSKMIKTA